MKVAVRNLGGARYPGNAHRTVDAQQRGLDDAIATGADILLLQEVVGLGAAFTTPAGWQATPSNPFTDWGSVVYLRDGLDADVRWRPAHPVLDTFGSYLDFALVHDAELTEVALVSVHAPPAWWPDGWSSTGIEGLMPEGQRRPWTSDVLLDVLVEAIGERPAVLAGDWNESRNYPSSTSTGTVEFFERTARHGLSEAVSSAFSGQVRTNFTRSARNSYQNDHVFLSAPMRQRLRSVAVWNEVDPRLSDHAGILVSLHDAGQQRR